MAVQNNGYFLIDADAERVGNTTTHIPLFRREKPVSQHYCAFWKADNSGYYVEEFAEILKDIFTRSDHHE